MSERPAIIVRRMPNDIMRAAANGPTKLIEEDADGGGQGHSRAVPAEMELERQHQHTGCRPQRRRHEQCDKGDAGHGRGPAQRPVARGNDSAHACAMSVRRSSEPRRARHSVPSMPPSSVDCAEDQSLSARSITSRPAGVRCATLARPSTALDGDPARPLHRRDGAVERGPFHHQLLGEVVELQAAVPRKMAQDRELGDGEPMRCEPLVIEARHSPAGLAQERTDAGLIGRLMHVHHLRERSSPVNPPAGGRLQPPRRRFLSIMTNCCDGLGALSVRWMQPGQQHGLRLPSCISSMVRRMRFSRVFAWLGVLDPADEFVAAERRQALPDRKDGRLGLDGGAHVVCRLMDCAMRKRIAHAPLLRKPSRHSPSGSDWRTRSAALPRSLSAARHQLLVEMQRLCCVISMAPSISPALTRWCDIGAAEIAADRSSRSAHRAAPGPRRSGHCGC